MNFSTEYIENIKFRIVDGVGTPVSNANATITGGLEPFVFTSDSLGESKWYYVPDLKGKALTINIPASGSFQAKNETPTIIFDSGVYEIVLSSADSISNSDSPIIFAKVIKTQTELETSGILLNETGIKNRYNTDFNNEFSTFYISEGDTFRLMLNFASDDLTGLNVSLLGCNFVPLLENVTTVSKMANGDAYYIEFLAPPLINEFVRIAVYNALGNPIQVSVTAINFIPSEEKENYPLMRWRNDCNQFGFKYEYDNTIFNQLRVPLIPLDTDRDYEIETEVNLLTREIVNKNFQHTKKRKFEAYYLDECGHDAMSVMISSFYVFINEYQFRLSNGYEQEFNAKHNASKATFELIDVDHSKRSV